MPGEEASEEGQGQAGPASEEGRKGEARKESGYQKGGALKLARRAVLKSRRKQEAQRLLGQIKRLTAALQAQLQVPARPAPLPPPAEAAPAEVPLALPAAPAAPVQGALAAVAASLLQQEALFRNLTEAASQLEADKEATALQLERAAA